ncbi:hypothetical protein AWB79_05595 [Caballeronia hypogeia]|uniref:Uncharacterized protein n=1 Tax=Caballeronia hypogeia TaxID=1777140 RepID=A0A158CLI6_9BURK|nr:hypothetical protein [Caballeronia hypogeia]SAK83149.1 hypothetical protein AWB79_05595 [Caballeronia hypogeia]
MERADYESALDQLVGAAELVASGAADEAQRAQAFEMLAFFRLRRTRIGTPATSDDELFKDTAIAALTMAGRREYLAAAALLDQARGLSGG